MNTVLSKKCSSTQERNKGGDVGSSKVRPTCNIHGVRGANRNRTLRELSDAGVARMCLQMTACVCACSIMASCTAATILHVSEDGDDSNPGTLSAPLLTIAHADHIAKPGYQIHVAPGTYRLSAPLSNSVGLTTKANGTAAARIKFISSIKGGAKLVVTGAGTAWKSRGNYVDIEGFDISGSGRHGILASGNELKIEHNFVHDLKVSGGCTGSGGAAIDTDGTVGNVLIENNVIRNIGYSMIGKCNTIQGIYVANSNNIVKNNIVSGVAAAGIHQWHGATASTILNNTVFQCKVGILIGQGDSGRSKNGSSDNYVANNIVYDNLTYGIVEGGAIGGNNRYVNNLTYRNGTNIRVSGFVKGTISVDPEFVHYEKNGMGDYRVSIKSPAIGRGAILRMVDSGRD